jgi:hypothetical protein
MSTELIPSNDLFSPAPVFDRNVTLLDHVTVPCTDRAAATRYLAKNAPDLMGMILGVAA